MPISTHKRTWVHVTYLADGSIEIVFSTDYWHGHTYIRRHKKIFLITRQKWVRLSCLMRVLSYSASNRYTVYAWNGFSVCWERRRS